MSEQLKKAISLAKKSNSSVILFNPDEPESSFAIVDLQTYEKMLSTSEKTEIIKTESDLTEEDLADKINREISLWKNRENIETLSEEGPTKKRWQISKQIRNKAQEIE